MAATAIACGDAGAGGGSASAGTTTTGEPTGEPGTTGESVTTGEPVTTGEASSTGPLACPDNLVPAPNSGFCADEATTPNCELVGPDHADQVCGVPVLAPATALARSSDVEDNAGAGPPDLACLTAPADRPVAPQTVTLEGVVRIVANGCESKQVEIAIYPLVDDGPGPEPIGAPFVTADDCTIAGVASPHPDCGTRHECTYSYPGVPTDTPLVVVTRGVLWAPVHAHDLYIAGAEVQDGKVTRDLRAEAAGLLGRCGLDMEQLVALAGLALECIDQDARATEAGGAQLELVDRAHGPAELASAGGWHLGAAHAGVQGGRLEAPGDHAQHCELHHDLEVEYAAGGDRAAGVDEARDDGEGGAGRGLGRRRRLDGDRGLGRDVERGRGLRRHGGRGRRGRAIRRRRRVGLGPRRAAVRRGPRAGRQHQHQRERQQADPGPRHRRPGTTGVARGSRPAPSGAIQRGPPSTPRRWGGGGSSACAGSFGRRWLAAGLPGPATLRLRPPVLSTETRAPMRTSILCTLTALGSLAGCEPDIPEPIWEGTHLQYSTTTSGPVCRGSFYRQEQHAVELARLLGFELPEPIRFTRVTPAEIPDHCNGLSVLGCAHFDSPYAFSIKSFHYHEIAHSVATLGGIEGAKPFAEGFAEVFSDGGEAATDRVPIDEVIRGFAFEEAHADTAGLFVRFLLERHGLDPLVDFMRSTDYDTGFAQFSPIFEDVFGEPLATAMDEFAAYPSCSKMVNRVALLDCDLPLAPWEGRTVTLLADVACDQDDVLGPTQDGRMFTTRGFEIAEAGKYLFFTPSPEGWSGFRVVKCGSCLDPVDFQLEPGAMALRDLTPGRYYVMFGRSVDAPEQLGMTIGQL